MNLPVPLGHHCFDRAGERWLYVGYRITTVGSHDHHFVKPLDGKFHYFRSPLWQYNASSREAIVRTFPSLNGIWP